MENLDLSKKSLRKFTIKLFFVLLLWGTFLLWRKNEIYLYFYFTGILLILTGLICPILIKPLYIILMKIAYIISWLITHLILTVAFYFIITPYGLVMRLFGFDPLERKLDKKSNSYWKEKKKKEFNKIDFERLF